eukprot:scaffold31_cov263-Pinguiococcus_pyrenoidosus.AAC.3
MKRSLDGTYMRGTEFWNALDERYRPGLGSIARPNLDKLGNLFRCVLRGSGGGLLVNPLLSNSRREGLAPERSR